MLHVLALMSRMRALVNGAGGERLDLAGVACDAAGQGPPALVLTRRARREAWPLLAPLVQAGFRAIAVDPCDADALLGVLAAVGPANLVADRAEPALEVAARAPQAVLRVLILGPEPALVACAPPVRAIDAAEPEAVAVALLRFARETRRGGYSSM